MSNDEPPTALPPLNLATFQSIKRVDAGEITEVVAAGFYVRMQDGSSVLLPYFEGMTARYTPVPGDFWVRYSDGYQSISPRQPFLDGYVDLSADPLAASDLQPTRMPGGEIRQMAQQPQSPSIGRVVLFTPALQPSDAHKVNGAEEFVAIIGQVFADPGNPRPYCNLFVMPPFAPPYWEGSVQEDDASGLVQPPMRSWRWPPRA